MSTTNANERNKVLSEVEIFQMAKVLDGMNLLFATRNIHRKLKSLSENLNTEFPEFMKEEIELIEDIMFSSLEIDKTDDRIYDMYCEFLETDMSELDFVQSAKGWE